MLSLKAIVVLQNLLVNIGKAFFVFKMYNNFIVSLLTLFSQTFRG